MSPKNEQRTMTPTNTIPDDNMIHPWLFHGEHLFRNYDNEVFSGTRDNLVWMGIYIPQENRIDTNVPEPEWADEDDADVMIVSEGPITLNGVVYAPGTVEIRGDVVTIHTFIDVEDEEDEDEDDADVMIVSEGPITLNGVVYAPGTFEIRNGVVGINNTVICDSIQWDDMDFGDESDSKCGICGKAEEGHFHKGRLVEDIICGECSLKWAYNDTTDSYDKK